MGVTGGELAAADSRERESDEEVARLRRVLQESAAAYIRGDIYRRLKHPMLVGVKTWAAAHLISNGDLGSIILFGSFLAWAVYDRITLKRRSDPGAPEIPTGGRRNDIIAIVVGTLLYLALGLLFHPLVVGVAVFGRPTY